MKPPALFLEYFEFPAIEEYWKSFIDNETHTFWICAYGSLLWYPNFNAETRILGYIDNVERQVCHGSFKFGTKEWPGRVATLFPKPGSRTWGAVYKVTGSEAKKIAFERLMQREIAQCYELALTNFVPWNEGEIIKAAVYIALPNSQQSLVEVPLEIQAYQIFQAKGCNGPNRNYVYNIANFLESEIIPVAKNAYNSEEDPIIKLTYLIREFENGKRELTAEQMRIAQPKLYDTT